MGVTEVDNDRIRDEANFPGKGDIWLCSRFVVSRTFRFSSQIAEIYLM